MNIFYLSHDPELAARYQYNKHIVKMPLESAQMLCTVQRYYGNENVPYKSTHLNHPSTIWARSQKLYYQWLYDHMMALGKIYTERYNKIHLAIEKCKDLLYEPPYNIPNDDIWVDPPQCMPEEYKVEGDSIKAYWNFYINGKKHIANKNEIIHTKQL